uniref:Uncharacterized protein n=1 Tax=Arundo donax TaxID=35708 RepID=A0A0A9BCL3_ARUDO
MRRRASAGSGAGGGTCRR